VNYPLLQLARSDNRRLRPSQWIVGTCTVALWIVVDLVVMAGLLWGLWRWMDAGHHGEKPRALRRHGTLISWVVIALGVAVRKIGRWP
jgi:hypothetical protein